MIIRNRVNGIILFELADNRRLTTYLTSGLNLFWWCGNSGYSGNLIEC